jgi:hypothetical protein
MKTINKLWIGLGVLAVISPIGLYLPNKFKAGSAWGEWSGSEIKHLIGYAPKGLEKIASLWKPVLPDYAFKGWEEKGFSGLSFAYILSAVLGVVFCICIAWVIGKILAKKESGRVK